jgi:3'-phosphoadenosine 5'-phosphosulfate sulfotransferase (PAPS reductase)/FAD synthetase
LSNSDVICWWSGGVTSAVACKKAIDLYGLSNCRIIFIDTFNEHQDTYRFLKDCSQLYGKDIETITGIGDEYESISEVWERYKSLNTANGAICSTTLKLNVRKKWQKENNYRHQVFGFEFETNELKRAKSLSLNYPEARAVYPLLMYGLTKVDCIKYLNERGVKIPYSYRIGLKNNNCLNTGCVQGGIGYWQKLKEVMPDAYSKMANMEHKLTKLKGKPVTMLKDQSKESMKKARELDLGRKYMPLFLEKNSDYPYIDTIFDKGLMDVKPLVDCNGFCGIDDIAKKNQTRKELNDE